jgi:hypothetical protein
LVPLQSRRFTLSDALILVAAMAVCLALSARQAGWYVVHVLRIVRHYDQMISKTPKDQNEAHYKSYLRTERNKDLFRATMKLNYWVNIPFPFLVFLSPTFLWLRLRKPRPIWGNLMRQPGTIACTGGMLTALLAPLWGRLIGGSWFVLSFGIVPVSWVILGASRQWRFEASWLDRAGRLIGIGWIAAAAYAFLYVWLGPFGGW